MAKQDITRIGFNSTADDTKTIRKLKAQLKPVYGLLTTTALIRMALRRWLAGEL